MSLPFNPNQFNSTTSISTHLNSIQFQFRSKVKFKSIQSKTISNKFNFDPLQFNLFSVQFNWIQNRIQHQFWAIHVHIKTNLISKQFDFDKPIRFRNNSIHFDSISISIHNISIQLQLNSIQFNFDSIQFALMKMDHLRLGRIPPYGKRKITISQKEL